MGFFNWFKEEDTHDHLDAEERIIVKSGRSKGPTSETIPLTVGDIRRGKVIDSTGYTSGVVLFLRKGKE